MRRALQLARLGAGHTSPNPMVGAVIVGADGAIIGEGWHRKCGEAHAEVNAVAAVKDANLLKDSTLYVTLEPCPMCAGALCHSHIGKIIWAADDPKNGFSRFGNMLHPKTKTENGVMRDECLALLTEFFKKKR